MNVTPFLYKNRLYWATVFLLVAVSCGNPQGEGSLLTAVKTDRTEVLESTVSKHLLSYWDNFNFRNQAVMSNPDRAEEQLVDFIALFPTVPDTVVQVALWDMLEKASRYPKTFDYFLGKYAHYLYDPHSPMRNEDYYEKVLSFLVKADAIPQEEKVRYASLLKLVGKNRVGTVASDFRYLAKNGRYYNLHEGTKPYKMLVFYDPTCRYCTSMMHDLGRAPVVQESVEDGFLDVVAVSLYPDKQNWKAYQAQIPSNWTNGFDEAGEVIAGERYHILAYPTIFVLDTANVVLLKDAPLDVTLRYLVELKTRDP